MDADTRIAELEVKNANLQQQFTEFRLRYDTEVAREASLLKHWVEQAVHSELEDRLPTKEERMHLTSSFQAAIQRAKDRNDLLMHFMKWGLGGTVAFFLYAGWDAVKAKLGVKGP
jgi:cell division septum initiation protein DivIVA